jgi:hypothetical protein
MITFMYVLYVRQKRNDCDPRRGSRRRIRDAISKDATIRDEFEWFIQFITRKTNASCNMAIRLLLNSTPEIFSDYKCRLALTSHRLILNK